LPILMTDIINNAPNDQKVRYRTYLYYDKPHTPSLQPWQWPSHVSWLVLCILYPCPNVLQSEDHSAVTRLFRTRNSHIPCHNLG
jgi:hypothetical protein